MARRRNTVRLAGLQWRAAMKLPRREFLRLAAGAAALPAVSSIARAQAYPTRPVRIIVGFPAGGTADIVGRLIGQWLSERFSQPFVVENRPGAAGNIATEAVVRAQPDGHTLLVAVSSNTVNAALYDKLPFNFARDIELVAGLNRSPLVLEVNSALPISTLLDFISYCKANPAKVSMASFGTGTISHATGELFKMMAAVNTLHVPYRGSSPMLTDLLAGQVHAAVDNLPASIGHIQAGKLRALAVTTALRSQTLADVPTVSEFLPGFEASTWSAIGVPKSTPRAITEMLNKEINAGLADPRIKARLADLGGTPFVASPAELGKLVNAEIEKWGKVVKFAGIKPE
jgi:tripartite-type tricarboxylate transporter receptor subunit TctC